jgi:hypothetical protein
LAEAIKNDEVFKVTLVEQTTWATVVNDDLSNKSLQPERTGYAGKPLSVEVMSEETLIFTKATSPVVPSPVPGSTDRTIWSA